jgi:hypothetical protein
MTSRMHNSTPANPMACHARPRACIKPDTWWICSAASSPPARLRSSVSITCRICLRECKTCLDFVRAPDSLHFHFATRAGSRCTLQSSCILPSQTQPCHFPVGQISALRNACRFRTASLSSSARLVEQPPRRPLPRKPCLTTPIHRLVLRPVVSTENHRRTQARALRIH